MAEESYTAAKFFNNAKARPSCQIICFHCHQAVKKYLSALEQESRARNVRSRNLQALAKPLLSGSADWAAIRPALQRLDRYDDDFTYPGHVATRADAGAALKACRSIRSGIRLRLGLPKR